MQYFKHMSNMRNDVKMKRIISRYGLEGYGLYNLILETITESLTTESPIPDLQETCEDIAEFYNGNTAKINEMVAFMLNQGLFEVDEITTKITCNKIYKYLEQSQTRSKEIRKMIASYKEKNEQILLECASQTVSDKSDRTEQNRTEQEKNKNIKEKELQSKDCSLHKYIFERFSVEYKNLYKLELDFTPKEVGSIVNIKKILKNKENAQKEFDNKFEILRNRCKDQSGPGDFWKLTPTKMYSQWNDLTPKKKQSFKDDPFYL